MSFGFKDNKRSISVINEPVVKWNWCVMGVCGSVTGMLLTVSAFKMQFPLNPSA